MSRITVDPELLARLGADLRQAAGQVRSTSARLDGALGRLDWMAGERAQVEGQVASARQQGGLLGDLAEKMAQFLVARAELFRAANGQAVAALPSLGGPAVPPERLDRIEREGRSPAPGPAPVRPAPEAGGPAADGAHQPLPKPERSYGRLVGIEDEDYGTRVNAPITNDPGDRDPNIYNGLLDQFEVQSNPRYAERDGNTFCNAYVLDVLWATGTEIPHKNADGVANWLANEGIENHGWKAVSAEEAQEYANKGYPTVATYHGGHRNEPGHLAMVRPGPYDAPNGPTIAQAGAENLNQTTIRRGFGPSRMQSIKYYVHP
ncbi:MAG: hypothetical protein K0R39_2687 [Symbiobacteriaceae bacterium]|nr:hypothetical protein [Symbiobacteriaceae bacterium]